MADSAGVPKGAQKWHVLYRNTQHRPRRKLIRLTSEAQTGERSGRGKHLVSLPQPGQVGVDTLHPGAGAADTKVGQAQPTPLLELRAPVVGRAGAQIDAGLDAETRRIAPGFLKPAPDPLDRRRPAADRVVPTERKDAVGQQRSPPEGGIGSCADPDWDRPL